MGHPPGRGFREDSGDEGELVTLSLSATDEKLRFHNAEPGRRAGTPEIRQLVVLLAVVGCVLICHVSKRKNARVQKIELANSAFSNN